MRKNNRYTIVFLCCVLAMPTCTHMLGGFHSESLQISLFMGALLGIAHLLIRPVLRLLTAPIGCLTLGLIQPVIDIALIYACERVVDGFSVTAPLHALLAVVLINAVTFIAAGRK